MKIDFSQKIIGLDGKTGDLTLRHVAVSVLSVNHTPDGRPLDPGDQLRRGSLTITLAEENEDVEIKPEDAALIKALLPLGNYPNWVAARAAKMLDG